MHICVCIDNYHNTTNKEQNKIKQENEEEVNEKEREREEEGSEAIFEYCLYALYLCVMFILINIINKSLVLFNGWVVKPFLNEEKCAPTLFFSSSI